MENAEEIFQCLEEFSKRRTKTIPRELEDYLNFVARTGDPIYQWALIKHLFKEKLLSVITEFYETTPGLEIPPCPNVDIFNYETMKNCLLEKIDAFSSAPFTIQRICELLTAPRKQYTRIDKFMRAFEKNILVVSTRDPGPLRRAESENGEAPESLVNGSDSNSDYNVDVEMEDMTSWKENSDTLQTYAAQSGSSRSPVSDGLQYTIQNGPLQTESPIISNGSDLIAMEPDTSVQPAEDTPESSSSESDMSSPETAKPELIIQEKEGEVRKEEPIAEIADSSVDSIEKVTESAVPKIEDECSTSELDAIPDTIADTVADTVADTIADTVSEDVSSNLRKEIMDLGIENEAILEEMPIKCDEVVMSPEPAIETQPEEIVNNVEVSREEETLNIDGGDPLPDTSSAVPIVEQPPSPTPPPEIDTNSSIPESEETDKAIEVTPREPSPLTPEAVVTTSEELSADTVETDTPDMECNDSKIIDSTEDYPIVTSPKEMQETSDVDTDTAKVEESSSADGTAEASVEITPVVESTTENDPETDKNVPESTSDVLPQVVVTEATPDTSEEAVDSVLELEEVNVVKSDEEAQPSTSDVAEVRVPSPSPTQVADSSQPTEDEPQP